MFVHVQILSASLPFCQGISKTRQADPSARPHQSNVRCNVSFLFIVNFLPGKYDFDQYKGFSVEKMAQIRQKFWNHQILMISSSS